LVTYKLTHRLSPRFAEPAPIIDWGNIQSFELVTKDKQTIGSWFIEGDTDRPIVLVLHGNGACRSWMLQEAEMLNKAGFGVMLISMRAHGDSTGEFNDVGFSAQHDVVAAVDWLHSRWPNRRIVIWGQSMGSAAALFAARELGERVQGYILECPYRDLKTAVRIRLRNYLPSGLNGIAYAGMLTVSQVLLPNLDEISPRKAMGTVPRNVPILILAGRCDPLATLDEARDLTSAAPGDCQLVVFETEAHIPVIRADCETCRSSVIKFVTAGGR